MRKPKKLSRRFKKLLVRKTKRKKRKEAVLSMMLKLQPRSNNR